MARLVAPAAAISTTLARTTMRCWVVCARIIACSARRSSSGTSSGGSVAMTVSSLEATRSRRQVITRMSLQR